MAKRRHFGMGKRIFASYIVLLVSAMAFCGVAVGGYVTKYARERTVESNSRAMSSIVYELDSLYQRIEQYISTVYESDIFTVIREQDMVYDYPHLKREITVEDSLRNSMQLSGLKSDAIGLLVYLDDAHYKYVGDGVVRRNMPFSGTEWYQRYAQGSRRMTVIGPLLEDYRPYPGTAQEVFLFIHRLSPQAAAESGSAPFIMMIVPARSIQSRLESFFDEVGAYVSNEDHDMVFSANLTARQMQAIRQLEAENAFAPDAEGLSVYREQEFFATGAYAVSFGWTLCAVNLTRDTLADIAVLVGFIVAVFAVCLVGGVAAAWLLSKRIMVPIQVMNQMISKMGQSEDAFVDENSRDEIGQIGQRFNEMKRRLQETAGRAALSEIREKQARLQALQAQINPHFLYNTLDNIYCMAQVHHVDDIASLTANLSAMMRYTIDSGDTQTDLESELAHVRDYVSILNLRYDNAIQYIEQVDVGLYEIRTMKLLLQPLVENAWKHGLFPKAGHRGKIVLSAEILGGSLLICVEDDGVGMDAQTVAHLQKDFDSPYAVKEESGGHGIALKNVHDRIRLAYGDAYGLRIESAPEKGCRVSLLLKF